MAPLLILLTLSVAFANGANDVSKGVATLVGAGLSSERRAMAWGTAWTLLGVAGAMYASQGMIAMFSGKGCSRYHRRPSCGPSPPAWA